MSEKKEFVIQKLVLPTDPKHVACKDLFFHGGPGYVDLGYNDLYCSSSYGWWLVSGGTVDFGYTGSFNSPTYGAHKIKNGQVIN